MKQLYTKITFIASLLLVFSGLKVSAQVYPVSSSTVVAPPYSLFLSDYYAVGSTRLQSTIVLNDFNSPGRTIKLQVTIEGEGIKLQTKPSFVPSVPINLSPGSPVLLSGSDFAQYLHTNNLIMQGVSAAKLNQSGGKLPEGLYNICVTALDYQSGKPLSSPQSGCMQAFIVEVQPPIFMQPVCEEVIIPTNPQNIIFGWQQSGGAPAAVVANTEYKLFVYEVTGNKVTNPAAAVNNNQAMLVYESMPLLQTTFNLDLTATQLNVGKTYVCRIQAQDVSGKDVYANKGLSEFCWFYYGYPKDGELVLKEPVNERTIGKNDTKIFVWGGSDKAISGQSFEYYLKVVEVKTGQDIEDAVESNIAWYTATIPPISSSQGANHLLTQNLTPNQKYAWKVEARTKEQKVAESQVFEFTAAPLMEFFYAGNYKVKIKSLSNTDINDLAGVCLVPISEDTSDVYEVEFKGLKVKEASGQMFLSDGDIDFQLTDKEPLALVPSLESNGEAFFHFEAAKVNKSGIQVQGYMKWPFPHPVRSGEKAFLTSNSKWLTLNSNTSKYNGLLGLDDEQAFDLLDPINHTLTVSENSIIEITDNVYTLKMLGEFLLPEKIKTNDEKGYALTFQQTESLDWLEVEYLLANATNYFTPLANSNFSVKPFDAIIDLSEKKSPGKLSDKASWKGVYFGKIRTEFPNDFDATSQITMTNSVQYDTELSENAQFWTDSKGLEFKLNYTLEQDENNAVFFNTFSAKSVDFSVKIEENQVVEGSLKGNIQIPFLEEKKDYAYTININNEEGIQEGFLDANLVGTTLVQAPDGGENRIDLTIKRAVFRDRERLELMFDASVPALSASMYGVSGFSIWGNNHIGFNGEIRGSKTLDNQAIGDYRGYGVTIFELGAAFNGSNYMLSYKAKLNLGEGVEGDDGPPIIEMYSVEPVSAELAGQNKSVTPAVDLPSGTAKATKIIIQPIEIDIDNPLMSMSGKLMLAEHTWGTMFQGQLQGNLKVPVNVAMGAKMVLGKKDGKDFWYFDGFFQDNSGRGLNIMNTVGLVALEGRVYHNMSFGADGDLVVDPNVVLGAALYLQLIEYKSGGEKFAADGAVEIQVNQNDYSFRLEGDISLFNENPRDKLTTQLKKQEIAKKAAVEIIRDDAEMISDYLSTEEEEGPGYLIEAPKIGGPQYLKEKLTASMGGSATGHCEFYYNSATEHFIANALVSSTEPPCVEGSLAYESKPKEWSLQIGSEEQRIEIYPSCNGFGGIGWVYADHTGLLEVGVGVGWKGGASLEFNAADCDVEIYAKAYAELLAVINVNLDPFKLNKAKIAAAAGASIGVAYDCDWAGLGPSGDVTLASVDLRGELEADFTGPSTVVSGELEGKIMIIEIFSKTINMKFNTSF